MREINLREILRKVQGDTSELAQYLTIDQAISEIKQYIKENLPEEYPIVESLIDERKIWMKGYNAYRTKTLKNMGIK